MTTRRTLPILLALPALFVGAFFAACGDDDDDAEDGASGSIIVYSGRSEALVAPLIADFTEASGIDVEVKYGDTAALAALLIEEGDASPADVYFAQDGGALGAVQDEELLDTLPAETLDQVDEKFRSQDGAWVGVSGRARVIVYNTDVAEADLPSSVLDLTGDEWEGQVGWAPTNGSFQAFVTALRQSAGEDAAKQWLEDMKANGVKEFPDNRSIVTAVAAGEVKLGLVNHYYLYGFLKDQGDGFKARNHFTADNDPGTLVNVAGAAILKTSDNKDAAQAFVDYLLSEEGQQYFSEQTYEYPLVEGIAADERLKPLAELDPPDVDLSDLDDLAGTLALLREAGVLQ